MRLGKLRDVDRFPLEVLPDVLQQLCKDVANACNNINVGMVATHLLTIAGGLMGRSVDLWLGESRYASACLFSGVIGGAGTSKSAALEYIMAGGRRVEDMLQAEFDNRRDSYAAAMEICNAALKQKPPIPGSARSPSSPSRGGTRWTTSRWSPC